MSWKYAGTDIGLTANSFYYGVTEVEAAYDSPAVRGKNPLIPLREGSLHTEKVFDDRKISLGFMVRGTSRADFEDKLDSIHRLFSKRDQQTLTNLSGRTAQAEVIPPFGFKKDSEFSGRMTVDFLCNDPFFRSTAINTTTASATGAPTNDTDFNIVNSGNVSDRSATIAFKGPMSYPRLTNNNNDVWIGMNGTVASGDTVTLDVGEFTSDPTNRTGDVEHSGAAYFMILEAGTNAMSLSDTVTGGTITVSFYDPFI